MAGPDKLILRGSRLPIGDKHRHVDEFDVGADESLTFSMTWIPSYERTPPSADPPIVQTIADERRVGVPLPRRRAARRTSYDARC